MKKISAPTYTQIPNSILDDLGSFEEVELTVILFICRQTFGWHKTKARITLERLISGTGRSNGQINVAITKLVKEGLIKKTASHRDGNEYEIVLEQGEPVLQPPENSSPTTGEQFSNHRRTVLQPPENPNKERKYSNKRSTEPDGSENKRRKTCTPGEVPLNSHKQFVKEWAEKYPQWHRGEKYIFVGAKDGAAVKRLFSSDPPMPVDHLIRIAVAAWQRTDLFNCRQASSISGFVSRINDIRAELNSTRNGKNVDHNQMQEKTKINVRIE